MPKRFTDSEKWNDPWFRKLTPTAKLMCLYLYDRCDIAGFWEIDLEAAAFDIGVKNKDILEAMKELERCYEVNGDRIWITRFINFQGNKDLNEQNKAHLGIIRLLRAREGFSENVSRVLNRQELPSPYEGACKGLFSPTSISTSKGNSKGNGNGKEVPNDTSFKTKKNRKLSGDKLEWFIEFWETFGYKSGKAAAADSWLDINGLNRELVDSIVDGAKKEVIRRKTLREDQTAIMAQGWLSARRWEDDYAAKPSGNGTNRALTRGAEEFADVFEEA